MRIKTAGWLLTLMLWLVVSSPAFGVIAEGFVTPDPKTNVGAEDISIEYFTRVSPGLPVAAPTAVPEPAGVALVTLGYLLLVARRQR